MIICGAVLAAGMSTRMGQNKLLLPFGKHSVIEEVIDQLASSDVSEVMVVTGYERDLVEKKVKDKFSGRITIIHNENYRLGRSESIKRAVENVSRDSDALLFMVGDKPTIGCELINRAIEQFNANRPSILYVKTPEGRGHPVIFAREVFGDLLTLSGDKGAGEIISRHGDKALELWDPKEQIDIDTREEYERLRT